MADRYLVTSTPITTVSTYAGTGSIGYTDSTLLASTFYEPFGVVKDSLGNMFIVDYSGHCIRKIAAGSGVVTTFAGLGGTSGDVNATGTSARFNSPMHIAVDSSDNLYVTDQANYKIKKITQAGVVTTYYGLGTNYNSFGITIDNLGYMWVAVTEPTSTGHVYRINMSTQTRTHDFRVLNDITPVACGGVAFDGTYIYVSPISSSTYIYKMSATALDGFTAWATGFSTSYGLCWDATRSCLFSNNGNEIKKITSAGTVTTIAGSSTADYVDGSGTSARFNRPWGLFADSSGDLYVGDRYNHVIRKIVMTGGGATTNWTSTDTSIWSTTSGGSGGSSVPTTSDIVYINASSPSAITLTGDSNGSCNCASLITTGYSGTLSGSGYLHINPGTVASPVCTISSTTTISSKIKLTPGSYNITLTPNSSTLTGIIEVAGSGTTDVVLNSNLTTTSGLVISGAGFNASTYNVSVSYVSITGSTVNNVQLGTSAWTLSNSSGVIWDCCPSSTTHQLLYKSNSCIILSTTAASSTRTFVVGNKQHNRLPKIILGGSVASGTTRFIKSNSILNGDGAYVEGGLTYIDELASTLSVSHTIKFDSKNGVFEFGTWNVSSNNITPAITITAPSDSLCQTVSLKKSYPWLFTGSYTGNLTGTHLFAQSNAVKYNGLTDGVYDSYGNLYISDTSNHCIRRIANTGIVSTFAGSGVSGYAEGTGTGAQFSSPRGITYASDGALYVCDSGNHCIRKITTTTTGVSNQPVGVTTLYAGIPTVSGSTLGASFTTAQFNTPWGISFVPVSGGFGFIITDSGNHCIKVLYSNSVSILAGANGTSGSASSSIVTGGSGGAARFNSPRGILWVGAASSNGTTVANRGYMIVADYGNNALRYVYTTNFVASIILGTGSTDGDVSTASVNGPSNLCGTPNSSYIYPTFCSISDPANKIDLFISDAGNNRIRRANLTITSISTSSIGITGNVSTLAGSTSGYLEGTGTGAQFSNPQGLIYDVPSSTILVCDTGNHVLRKIYPNTSITSLITGTPQTSGASDSISNSDPISIYRYFDYLTGNTTVYPVSGGTTQFLAGSGSFAGSMY